MLARKPWVEKYRPTSLDDVIFTNSKVKTKFDSIVKTGDLPNLMLFGPPGTGKTSLSKALCRDLDIDAMDILRINCSDEKIDAMRDKVKAFSMTMPIGRNNPNFNDPRPEFKVVQLEEFDALSFDAQRLLRALIEQTSGSCRFIGTCNYVNKIIPALRSRFQEFELHAPNLEEVVLRAAFILEDQNVSYDAEVLETFINAGYPDFRKIINLLEQHSVDGKLTLGSVEKSGDWQLGLFPLLDAGDFKGARKLVCESAGKEELIDVYRFLFDNITKFKKLKGKEDQAIVLIAQYQFQHGFVADQELQIAALFVELSAL